MNFLHKLIKTKNNDKFNIGNAGEEAVAKYVKARGMRILYRNWRHGRFELDMVCKDGDTVVFLEVKTRKIQGITQPLEGISPKKRISLTQAARAWLMTHEAWHEPCRFDVAGVLYDAQEQNPTLEVKYYDNAFDFSPHSTMGGSNTSWQPW